MRFELVRTQAPGGVEVEARQIGDRIEWSIVNGTPVAAEVDHVVLELRPRTRPAHAFVHGYQSWSPSGGVEVGDSMIESDSVIALRDERGMVSVAGFAGGDRHGGTFTLAGGGAPVLQARAELGGARIEPGERRVLHDVVFSEGDDHHALLVEWARVFGTSASARVSAPYQVGWCSWYQYFHDVTERDIRSNLALADDWPFDVFQIDDGYQAAIGDWLVTNERFPSSLESLASTIDSAGRTPGIWLAPFLVHPSSRVAIEHPEWIARWRTGDRALIGNVNDAWGGRVVTLDTTQPEVLEHLARTAKALVDMGFTYLKLDFTYAPALPGVFADRSQTPAQRVRAGYDAIRQGAGDDAFLLGCGAPLGAVVGAVEGMRIGADVAPSWHPRHEGDEGSTPATVNAWRGTLARSFQHRRLWLNDPDCLMLRTTDTALTPAQVDAWCHAVAASGGMALVSDDLSLLDGDARRRLDDVVALGREVDAAAAGGAPPRCADLLDAWTPGVLQSGSVQLRGDPDAGTATLERR